MTAGPRKCWDCGGVAQHADNYGDAVKCQQSGSYDTRPVKTTSVFYSVQPYSEDTFFCVGDTLLPMREFPSNCKMVRIRKLNCYGVDGFIIGDGATNLLEKPDPLPWLKVTEVSEISGWAKATEGTQ